MNAINTIQRRSLVSMDQVTKNFVDRSSQITYQVIRGIDLEIPEGRMCSIVGPSGVGKSTFLKLLAGMIRPTTGKIVVDDKEIQQMKTKELRDYRQNMVGLLWQSPSSNILSELSVLENVLLPLSISNEPREVQKKRSEEVLEILDLQQYRDRHINQLSGGEAQKVGLAAALAKNPPLLLADEPTGELDVQSKFNVLKAIEKINKELGITVIIVTHDIEIASHVDFTYSMLDGTIAELKTSRVQQASDRDDDRVVLIDQFGRVRIPDHLREEVFSGRLVKFRRDNLGRVYLEPIEEEM